MRTLDFALRFAFFATVPFLAAQASALFPMTGVLVNVALALVVFAFAEGVRTRAERSRTFAFLMRRHLAFEAHYRKHPPGPFLSYVISPLLLPYWLFKSKARRELWLYRGLTGGGLLVLLITSAIDFWRNWQPELSFDRFIALWAMLFAVQTLLTLVFLMPIATTVVKYHLERRFTALWILLAVAALSVGLSVRAMVVRRSHVVSWVTTERTLLRTRVLPEAAKSAQLAALREVWAHPEELRDSTDKRGWVEDDALDRAEEVLERFYRPDEAYAFSLHAVPPEAPEILLLQCNLGWGRPALWRALRKNGQEVLSKDELPPGVLGIPRKATRQPPSHRQRAPYKQSK